MNLIKLLFFSLVQLGLIFFYIHTRSTITRFSYLKQRAEKKHAYIHEENMGLIHMIEKYKNRPTLRDQAIKQEMIPLRLKNIRQLEILPNNNESLLC